MDKINIRKATKQDQASVLGMVRELAEYEHAKDQVSATVQNYEENFEAGVFNCFVAELDGEIVGIALYYLSWSTWRGRMLHLEDLVVKEQHRKKGIGQKLFDAYINEAKALNCFLVRWEVLDWNEPALKFYEKNEAIIEKNWWNGKIFLKKI